MNPLIGTRLDQYRIDTLLGEGGMGSVFRGWDTSLSRPVAIKVMHPQFASQPEFRERFLQEAKAPARLSHPSIVHIYNFGSQQGILYIVMEFIPGSTLSVHIRQAAEQERMMHLKETLVVLAQVADALAYAHQNGVIHRDVKPDNIMLRHLDHPDREGDPPLRAGVTDFGLAKLLEGGVETQTGMFLGTLSYMSPEQCFGLPLDGRSDVYSLGVVLYRLATGRLPLDIQTPTDAIIKHQTMTPPPPRELRSGIPPGVETLIQKAIAKQPQDRYQNATDLYRDLRRAADKLSDQDLSGYASPEKVFSIVTQPQKADEDYFEKPDIFDKVHPSPGGSRESRIHILIPDKTIRSVTVKTNSLIVGRGEDSDIVVDDPLISRHHARIEFDGRQFSIIDLNSTNGTYLEDVRLLAGVRETWNADKMVHVGNCWLKLEVASTASTGRPVSLPEPPAIEKPGPGFSLYSSMGGRVSIYLAQTEFTLQPGSGLSIPVVVLNQGAIVDHFRLSLKGLPAEWSVPSPPELQLMPGKRGEITLNLPPPPASLSAGKYQARLHVGGQVTPDEVAAAEIILQVTPRYSYDLSLQPQKHRSLAEGRFNLEVVNHGNVEIRLQLSAQDPENYCQFTFTPNPAVIPALQTIQVPLSVRSLLTIPGWSGKTYSFVVTGRMEGDPLPPRQVHGEWEQVPPDIEISLVPQSQRSPLRGSFTVQLKTFSPDPSEILLEATDTQSACIYEFSPPQIRMSAGQANQASLTLLPRDNNLSQEVPFTVTARLASATHLYRQVSGTWEPIKPSISLELVPRQQSSPNQAIFTVELRNQNLIDLSLELIAWDAGNLLQCTVSPSQLTLPSNATRTAQLLVQTRQAQINPRAQTHSLIVAARLAGIASTLQQATGEWMQLAEPAPLHLPEPITLAEPVHLPEPVRAEKPRSRWFQGCIAFLICLILTAVTGFMAGSFISNLVPTETEPWIGAIAVWLIGLWISVRVFNRVRKAPTA